MTPFPGKAGNNMMKIPLAVLVVLAVILGATGISYPADEPEGPPAKPSEPAPRKPEEKTLPKAKPIVPIGGKKDLTLFEIQSLAQNRDLDKGRLAKMLTSKDAKIRRAAAVALGCIREPRTLIELGFNAGREEDPEVLAAILFALGQAAEAAARQMEETLPENQPRYKVQLARRAAEPLRNLLAREDGDIPGGAASRALAIEALGKTGLDNEAYHILPALYHPDNSVQAEAIQAILRTDPLPYVKSIGARVGSPSPLVSMRAAWALATVIVRDKKARKDAKPGIVTALASKDFWTRYYGYVGARRALLPGLAPAVVRAAKSEKSAILKIAAAKALGQFPAVKAAPQILKKMYVDPNPNVRMTAIRAAGNLGDDFLILEAIDRLKKEQNLEVKAAILRVHARRHGSKAIKLLEPYVVETDVNFRIRMAENLGMIGTDASLKLLRYLMQDPNPRVQAAVLRTLSMHSIRVDEAYRMAKESLNIASPAVRYEALIVLHSARKIWATDLIAAQYIKSHRKEFAFVRLLILKLLVRDFEDKHIPLFRLALADADPEVRVAARNFFRNTLNREEEISAPISKIRTFLSPPPAGSRYDLSTLRGSVILETLPDVAPAHAAAFDFLIRKQFYDGFVFHRIDPGVVAETGDPLGVGLGGLNFFVPDEANTVKHMPGVVGASDRGRDTGGSQIYFCLTPLPELDGRFTVFARVVKGMDVLAKLQFGDKIISVRPVTKKPKTAPKKKGKGDKG